ncbi:TRAP transporter substrate-binding protein DctP [Ruegeria sp.]|uniref:TRAP transporter substrate-binding protein DctP n=1 Tax=Ruegeria sp. TaxID=1879320 RepID=UPI003C7E9DD7
MQVLKMGASALGLAIAVALSTATSVAAEKVTLKFASFTPAKGFNYDEVMIAFLDKVVADSEGTLDYKAFPGGTLGRNPSEQLKLVQDGIADIAFVVPSYTAGAFPNWGVTEIPGLVLNVEESAIALQRAVEDGIIETPEGVEMVGVFSSEVNSLHGTSEFTSLDDLKGLRIRAIGKPQIEAINRLGGTAVSNLRATEVAEGISRGTADATVMGHIALESFRVKDATNSHIRVPMGAVGLLLPLNKDTWDSLPEPAKAAFRKHGYANFAKFAGEGFARGNAEAAERIYSREGETELVVTDEVMADFLGRIGDVENVWIDGDPERQKVYDYFVETLEEIRAGS